LGSKREKRIVEINMAEKKETFPILFENGFFEKIKAFKKDWHKVYKEISREKTPQVDGKGRQIIKKRGDGKDYIEEVWMRECLDKHFPGWSWEMAAPLHFLGSEWVVAQGHLIIIDEHLLPFGIHPPVRRYYGVDSVRIQYKADKSHTPENIIDIGDNCKQANTSAMKVAINRMCHIGDDVYGKRVEEEGSGSQEDFDKVILETGDKSEKKAVFQKKARDLGFKKPSDIYHTLQVKSLDQIEDYEKALKTLEEVKEKQNTTE